MNTRKTIAIVLLIVLAVLCIAFGMVYRDYNDKDNYINKLRTDTNSIYSDIKNNGLAVDTLSLGETEGISITVIDLNETIIYSNNDNYADANNILVSAMYQDNSYIKNNPEKHKISLPIYDNNTVAGFVIFEKVYAADKNIRIVLITLLILIVIILLAVTVWFIHNIFSDSGQALLPVKNGMDDMTTGVLKKIPIPQNTDYYELYASYNKLVEEIGYINQKNMTQQAQRKKFITMISHEIRTPLTAITAYAEAIIEGVAKDKDTEREYIQVIYDRTRELSRQVEDFFRYSQDDVNVFKYNFEECYADEMVEEIFRNLRVLKRNNTYFHNDIAKCLINADKFRIEQVINNLYDNAAKHTDEEDEIILSAYREDNSIVISVMDRGEGISIKDLPHVFDYFYQGEISKKNDYDGVGLGLPICKQIVDSHGGKITVKISQNEGTTFVIMIPVV